MPIFALRGIGVTALNRDAALALVRSAVFGGAELPRIIKLVEDIDVSTLDEGHILPNAGNPAAPGIWFPIGFQ